MKKFRFFSLFILFLLATTAFAQDVIELNLPAKLIGKKRGMEKGTELVLTRYCHEMSKDLNEIIFHDYYLLDQDGNQFELTKDLDEMFEFHYPDLNTFWKTRVLVDVLPWLNKKGMQEELRLEMEQDALDYIAKVKEYNLEFKDPFLESYIYGLICKIAPSDLLDGRMTDLNVLIQQDPAVNARSFPNGTIVLTTGLLASLHTEDELVAILAREIAHFVLDHNIENVNKAVARKNRAAFWSGLLTVGTAIAEGVGAARGNYHMPGVATAAVAALTATISSQVIDRLGMKYDMSQQQDANKIAIKVLEFLHYDSNALATALYRIHHTAEPYHVSALYLEPSSLPEIMHQIKECGYPSQEVQLAYEQRVSWAVTNVAYMKFSDRRFKQCIPLLTQNINNGVGYTDDYLLKARCMLFTQNTEASNREVLRLIEKGTSVDPRNINAYNPKVIALLRLGRPDEAINVLKEYIQELDAIQNASAYITDEHYWARRMLVKIRNMYPERLMAPSELKDALPTEL